MTMRRVLRIGVVVLVMVLVGCSSTESSGDVDDAPTTEEAEDMGSAEAVAVIAFGGGYNESELARADDFLTMSVDTCSDLDTAEQAADLFAGVVQVIDDAQGKVDEVDVMRQLEDAYTGTFPCKDAAVGVAALMGA